MGLLSGMRKQRETERRANFLSALLHYEAKKGGELFGAIPKGHRREFFCLDERTWVWHEEWIDETGQSHAVTTRYDVRSNTVLKSQGSMAYQALNEQELRNFYQAVRMYGQMMESEYGRMLATA